VSLAEPAGFDELRSDLDSNMRMFGMNPANREHRKAYVGQLKPPLTKEENDAYERHWSS
jgi:hypothetical protein